MGPSQQLTILMSKKNQKLRELLANSFGSNENPWISNAEANRIDCHVSDGPGILVDRVRFIYANRGRRNSERGSPIEGFPSLLQNLEMTRAQKILIHRLVDARQRDYRIFTDSEMSELIGLLRFPKEAGLS